MRSSGQFLKFKKSLAFQISLVCWLVAMLTLIIFIAVIIPEQKKDLQTALLSKARGVASSLQDVTAGAAVSEDYSSVVDQCHQVLAGDDAIDYLVISKNGGFSVIVTRSGWRTAQLDSFWRPQLREMRGEIETVPYFNRRVFHFAKPFDYSAIQWGWINAGLSLKSYDGSVRTIYIRTGGLAVLCVILSLLISISYAKRQVRPILDLQSAVQRVAEGDLSARANIHSANEIEGLAHAFNSMAASILQRNEILESVRCAAQEFLAASDLSGVVNDVLSHVGIAARASHIWICGSAGEGGSPTPMRFEWTAPDVCAKRPDCLEERGGGAERNQGAAVSRELPDPPPGTQIPAPQPAEHEAYAQSLLTFPIVVNEVRLGILGVDDCTQVRDWNNAEKDCFRTLAGMIGASIVRQRALEALREAKETLEVRVEERTRELREEVAAKDRAHKELAQAQENLIRLSRQSGMAEIATSVLHNVGNVLNSVNVSTTIVSDKVRELRLENLVGAIDLVQQHRGDLPEFIDRDPQGRRVLPYLVKVGKHLLDERQNLLGELDQLRNHVEHIKGIVSTQQSYAKVSGLVEEVNMAELVDDACRILQSGFERHRITIERDYEPLPRLATEKHAVMQILLNLIRNAKESIKLAGAADRSMRISIRRIGDSVRVEIIDSGVGIAPQNLTRIFSHGFTTKPDGHGFGLHSSALDAHKLGGTLTAASEGHGLGATFTLELPIQKNQIRSVA